MSDLPTVALSIQQPWAWLIVNGHKDVENRIWSTRFRGPVLIHAGKRIDRDCLDDWRNGWHPAGGNGPGLQVSPPETFPCGGIVGVADIVDCQPAALSSSQWTVGPWCFALRNARPLPFMPLRGQLGFFHAKYVEPAHA